MSFLQINASWPHAKCGSSSSLFSSQYLPPSSVFFCQTHILKLPKTQPMPVYSSASFRKSTLMCYFGGKGKSENDNESSPWKFLEKAMGGLKKELTVQDVLREQRQAKEFDDGDNGGAGNRFGDGGGGGGGGSGDSEDDGIEGILDEVLQVVLATLGFIFVYMYILEGEEMTLLARDYIKYLFGGRKSLRLQQAMFAWGRFWKRMTRQKKTVREDWLEQAILATPTWWHRPRQSRFMRSRVALSYE